MGQVFPRPPILRIYPLMIGATAPCRNIRGQSFPFNSAIDELAIIASPLTAEEIFRIHEPGRSGS